MKNDNKKLRVGLGLVLFFLLFSIFSSVGAQTTPPPDEYVVLAPLPGIADENCVGNECKTTLQRYLPGVFNLMIGVAAVLAFVVIVWGGITYATTDSFFGKEEGKKHIENAVWGLLLVIGSWVILYTINPQILNFDLILPRSKIVGTDIATCINCQTFATNNIPTRNSANGKSADAIIMGKLITLNQRIAAGALPDGGAWYVTEGYPESYPHLSTCHKNGSCVDANISNATIKNIKGFLNSAYSAGMSASYEVKSLEELRTLATQAGARIIGTSFKLGNGLVVLNTRASGPHFHLK